MKKEENTQKNLVYIVHYDPKQEDGFAVHPIPVKDLSYKHPLVKKAGAIFADKEYADQFKGFISKAYKEKMEERRKALLDKMRESEKKRKTTTKK